MTPISQSLIESQRLAEKIETLLLESEGEVNENLEQLLGFQMESGEALKRQVDNVGLTIDRLESLHDFYTKKILALNRVLSSIETAKERLEKNVMESIQSSNLEAIRGHHIEMKLRNNPPSVDIYDQSLIPEQFIEITMTSKIKKNDIKDALKNGCEVPGARLLSRRSLKIAEAKIKLDELSSKGV